MQVEEIPKELLKILDKRGGKFHNREGSVVACLAEILTRYEEMMQPNTGNQVDPSASIPKVVMEENYWGHGSSSIPRPAGETSRSTSTTRSTNSTQEGSMKLFQLERITDETGISGTGIVAEGLVFTDGTCTMRWLTRIRSTTIYANMDDVREIHGHNGKTIIRWYDHRDQAFVAEGR